MASKIIGDLDLELNAIRLVRPSFLYNTTFKTLPGLKFDKKSKSDWIAPLSWSSALMLRATFGEDIEWTEDLNNWLFDLRENKIDPGFDLRDSVEADLDSDEFDFLRNYQKAGVKFLSTMKTALLADGMGSGKALANSEKVLTPGGYVCMGDIELGDKVIGSQGTPVDVIGVYPQGERDIYKVTFTDGAYVFVDGDHLWSYRDAKDRMRGNGYYKTKTTLEMKDQGDRASYGISTYEIPVVKPVEFSCSQDLIVDPYILGALLGDGGLTGGSAVLSTADPEILDEFSNLGLQTKFRSGYDYSVQYPEGSSIQARLRALGVWGLSSYNKFVPEDYLYSSVQDRISILQGLMDTDGGLHSTNKSGSLFYTSSPELAMGVVHLVESLGGLTRISTKKVPTNGNYEPITVTINLPEGINPFRLPRKRDNYNHHDKYIPNRKFKSIEFSHREDATCIKVSALDSLFVMKRFVVTHNTYTSGAAVRYLHEVMQEETLPLLIVCPNSTKRSWKKDLSKIWPGVDIQVVSGTAAKKRKTLESGADVYIVNWEGLKGFSRLAPYGSVALKRCVECGGEDEKVKPASCHVHEKELNKIPFKAIIADEIHRAKDGKSQTTRALRAIAQSSGASVRFGLSGTPMGNNYDDLWSPLNFILPESYPSKTKYIDYYLETSYDLWGGLNIIGIKKDKEDEFFLGLDPYMRRMPKELILSELPEKTYETRYVEMTAKQAKAYKQMQEGMIAELEGGVTIATTPLVKMGRLLQLASAYGEIQQMETKDKETGEMKIKEKVILNDTSCKLDAFMDDLPDFEGESVAVFSASKQIINLLSARLTKKNIAHGLITGDQDEDERQFYMDKFQAGDIKFILLTTGAGGTGITLTEGSTAVYLTRPFSMIESSQSEDRVHRIGSEKHDRIRYIDYITEGTVDEDVIPALQAKDDRLESVLRDKELLRKLIKGEKD